MGGDGDDVVRVIQVGRPLKPAVLARQSLANRISDGRGLPLALQLLLGSRATP
ncbi:hypothetical protein [Streptomyces sp. CC224B]|uniref:hypothetical protein n=1 Tax=Streptomyces sp. CC224B TaxID=3044571 RepID=UPI0024A82F22|nr:hypothetical protein [Streptomyces sp. CC224B]